MDFLLLLIRSFKQYIHYASYNPFIQNHAGGTQTQEMAVFCEFCVSFHASSYCMLTERTSALMFQNYEKYVNKSSIFNKVAL